MHTWTSVTRDGNPFRLEWNNNIIIWQGSEVHSSDVSAFFRKYNPLHELPVKEQSRLLHELCVSINLESITGVPEKTVISFWKLFPKLNLEEKKYTFQTKISNANHWKLDIGRNGLTWYDLSQHFSQTKTVVEQNLADFWFYGPLYPLPSIEMRTAILTDIKNALLNSHYPFPDSHFPLIKYPTFVMGPMWEDGDHLASNFVIMREYGIEDGRQNFHDGLVFLNFTSFEHCLTRNDIPEYNISKDIIHQIKEIIKEDNPLLAAN